ncbi:MAG TPA: hypothetical protein VEH49_03945, partial [Methylomirabilota bacterium]|nr:hypothetical protein [Methylomirabilota bacterium]
MTPLNSTELAAEPQTPPGSVPAQAVASKPALPSLPESFRTIPVAHGASWLKKVLAFAGPGYLVAV